MNARVMQAARSVGIIGATVALISGVTFAALTSNSVTLSDNQVSTASAGLQVWNGSSFDVSAPGFQITNLVPGHGSYNPFYLKNSGGVDLALTAHVPTAPSSSGFSGWSNLKVYIYDNHTGNYTNTTMADLLAGDVNLGDTLGAGAQGTAAVGSETTDGNFQVKYDIDPAAINSSQATVGSFDLVFSGTDVSSSTPTP